MLPRQKVSKFWLVPNNGGSWRWQTVPQQPPLSWQYCPVTIDANGRKRYYTDGACSGNPGPGGWAWIVPNGPFGAGPAADTTNQRMELQAVLEAVRHANGGPIEIVSDSTYVVNCFRDEWWKGWIKRGWKNSQKKPVANRDLWEPLIELVNDGDVEFTWVKGHAGDTWNDYADRLAVEATFTQQPRSGDDTPAEVGDADELKRTFQRGGASASSASPSSPAAGTAVQPRDPTGQEPPAGHRLVVLGLRPTELGGYGPSEVADKTLKMLIDIIAAKAQMFDDLVVVTGLRLGAEMLAAEAAVASGVRLVAVLPYPDPDKVWPKESRDRFAGLLTHAESVLTLQKKQPEDKKQASGALGRRDSWFARAAHEALIVWDHQEPNVGRVVKTMQKQLGEDEVWILDPNDFT